MKIRICRFGAAAAALWSAVASPVFAQVNLTTYHNDNTRTGQFVQESLLTPLNVNSAG